jgi:hypothetical protein
VTIITGTPGPLRATAGLTPAEMGVESRLLTHLAMPSSWRCSWYVDFRLTGVNSERLPFLRTLLGDYIPHCGKRQKCPEVERA